MRFAIAAILKDEHDSLLEWLAFHRVMGASHFFLADNGSSDGTRECLAALAREGWVTLIDVPSEPGVKPQLPAYQRLLEACAGRADVVAFIDADEFLLPDGEPADGGLLPWLEARFADSEVGAVAVNWACFGSGGARFREPGLVIERFTQRATRGFGPNRHFKSLVRPAWVGRFTNPHRAELSRGRYVNARGEPLEMWVDPKGERRPGLSQEACWEGARLNHYLVKSVEEFVLGKAGRGSAATPGLAKHRDYFERHDRNDETCHLALAWAEATRAELARLEARAADAAPGQEMSMTAHEGDKGMTQSRSLGRRLQRELGQWFTGRRSVEERVPGLLRWALDYPSPEREPRLSPAGRIVQGWVLLKPDEAEALARVRIVAEWQPSFELCHPLELARPDVVAKVLQDEPSGHPQLCCGFRFSVPPRLGHFRLWLALDGQRWLLSDVRVEAAGEAEAGLKVLEGREGWLFLDNDTNGSVDQFTGRMRLTAQGLAGWQAYLAGGRDLAERHGIPWALLVAPSKESVMGAAYHPRPAGEGGPMAQVEALPEAACVVHPVAALQALGDDAFIRTDTHWTHRGAREAALALAEHLGLKVSRCRKALAKDRYKRREMGGDLGNKLTPQRTCEVEVPASFTHGRHKAYDNGLPNFGRLLVTEYDRAVHPGTCLIFGSSSSYFMLNYLCRFFRRVVLVHSAGNLDPGLVASVRPDFLVAQTNARFVVQVPALNQPLVELIHDKVARLNDEERALVEGRRRLAPFEALEMMGLASYETAFSSAW